LTNNLSLPPERFRWKSLAITVFEIESDCRASRDDKSAIVNSVSESLLRGEEKEKRRSPERRGRRDGH
jgi:hypothetical protein